MTHFITSSGQMRVLACGYDRMCDNVFGQFTHGWYDGGKL